MKEEPSEQRLFPMYSHLLRQYFHGALHGVEMPRYGALVRVITGLSGSREVNGFRRLGLQQVSMVQYFIGVRDIVSLLAFQS